MHTFRISAPFSKAVHRSRHAWTLAFVALVLLCIAARGWGAQANPPLPNATFGSFPAACHYRDGTFVPDKNQKTCARTAPHTGAKFTFWHPDLVTMHVWAWYPNPAGVYSSTNPLVAPFNHG